MAAHHLSIARAAFAAGLLRPDVTKVRRDDLAQFHEHLNASLSACRSVNIQKCKDWLLENVTPSLQRNAAFTKFLVSLAKHLKADEKNDSEMRQKVVAARRKRLHILYLLNDVLHHLKYHAQRKATSIQASAPLQDSLPELFRLVYSDSRRRVKARLEALVDIWEKEQLLPQSILKSLRNTLAGTDEMDTQSIPEDVSEQVTANKETAFILPPTHGDPSTPYYDLPAGNFMPHIMPNSSAPMRPGHIRPLQFATGPADEGLVSALKDFLKETDALDKVTSFYEIEGIVPDIDEMGQLSYSDERGEIQGDTYYGWSRSFCEKMKRRHNDDHNLSEHIKSRTRSTSSNMSLRKRRRLSGTSSERSRSRSRSPSQSRSRGRGRGRGLVQGSDAHRGNYSRSDSSPRGMTQRPIPPPNAEGYSWQAPAAVNGGQSFMPATYQTHTPKYPPFTTTQGIPGMPPPLLGPNGFPVPPPPPPTWNGRFPPPPPPVNVLGLPFPPSMFPDSGMTPPDPSRYQGGPPPNPNRRW